MTEKQRPLHVCNLQDWPSRMADGFPVKKTRSVCQDGGNTDKTHSENQFFICWESPPQVAGLSAPFQSGLLKSQCGNLMLPSSSVSPYSNQPSTSHPIPASLSPSSCHKCINYFLLKVLAVALFTPSLYSLEGKPVMFFYRILLRVIIQPLTSSNYLTIKKKNLI